MQVELFRHLLAERGLVVMERRQTVQELHVRVAGERHHLRVHLIPAQQRNPLRPLLFGFAHRHPHIGIDKVRALHARRHVFRQRDFPTVLFRQRAALCHQALFRPAGFRGHQAQIQPGQRRRFQHRVAHVVARVARVDQRHLVKRLARQVLLHGQQVRQQLRRVELVGQPVPHRHARILRQRFDDFLAVPAILNAVVHPPEHARGVLN